MSHFWNSVWHRRTGKERRVGWRRWSVHWLCFPSESRVVLNMLYTEREVIERKICFLQLNRREACGEVLRGFSSRLPPMRLSGERKSLLAGYVHSSDFDLFYIRDIRDIRRNILSKLIEICMETLCWWSPGLAPTWRTETNRNSSVLYHKTKNLFEAKICLKISFQLL